MSGSATAAGGRPRRGPSSRRPSARAVATVAAVVVVVAVAAAAWRWRLGERRAAEWQHVYARAVAVASERPGAPAPHAPLLGEPVPGRADTHYLLAVARAGQAAEGELRREREDGAFGSLWRVLAAPASRR